MMGSHGKMGKSKWYEEAISIPLIVSYPQKMTPGENTCLVSPVDFLPTLLGLSGISISDDYDGKDLSAAFQNDIFQWQDTVFLAGYTGDPYSSPDSTWMKKGWRGVRTPTHSFVITRWNGTQTCYLYDLMNDKW